MDTIFTLMVLMQPAAEAAAEGGADPNQMLERLVTRVGYPCAAIACFFALRNGKNSVFIGILLAVLVSSALVFAPESTWDTIGGLVGRMFETVAGWAE